MEILKNIFYFIELVFIGLITILVELPMLMLLGLVYLGYCIWELVKFIFNEIRCYNIWVR